MEEEKCTHMAEIEDCSAKPEAGSINGCKTKTLTRSSLDASETTSSSSSQKTKGRRKGLVCKRRNPRVLVRRTGSNVAAIGHPLGMSFAAVMAQVLYRRDAASESLSSSHLSLMCTSAIKESLASVFGNKLDGLTRNFEQSFDSTLSTLRLIYESSQSSEGNKYNNLNIEIPSSKLNKGDCSSDIVTMDGHSGPLLQDQSISREEVRDNFHMDSVSRDLILHGQSNQMVCFPPTSSGSVINHSMMRIFEESVAEQRRSNDLKEIDVGLTMQGLKYKEIELAQRFDLNDLERSKLAMGASKASFKAEKFKNELEDTRHGELNKKCIDCLIAGLFIMSSSLFYSVYAFSYERITEATGSCAPSSEESFSWWTPNCIFAPPAVNNIFITDYADYFHSFDIRNWLWLLWQTVCRHTGREWLCVALILGDSMLPALLIYCLHRNFVPNPSWTSHHNAKPKGEYKISILDSPIFVLCHFACVSTIVLWSHAFC
ncbi:protein CPR5-like [Sesbania bispinosa]|nr:protein CPR5-like [Sesbania bispinosa]